MREAGRKVNEGQEVRMPSIVADAGAGLGMLEALHDLPSGRDFSDTLQRVTASHHGHAGRRWLQHWPTGWTARKAKPASWSASSRPQPSRSTRTRRCGGWPGASPRRCCRRAGDPCRPDWLARGRSDGRGAALLRGVAFLRGHTGSGEKVAALLQVRAFLEKNGDALFTWWHRANDDHRPNTALRVGFKRWVNADGEPVKRTTWDDYCDARAPDGGRSMDDDSLSLEYLVLPEQFRADTWSTANWKWRMPPSRFWSGQMMPPADFWSENGRPARSSCCSAWRWGMRRCGSPCRVRSIGALLLQVVEAGHDGHRCRSVPVPDDLAAELPPVFLALLHMVGVARGRAAAGRAPGRLVASLSSRIAGRSCSGLTCAAHSPAWPRRPDGTMLMRAACLREGPGTDARPSIH